MLELEAAIGYRRQVVTAVFYRQYSIHISEHVKSAKTRPIVESD